MSDSEIAESCVGFWNCVSPDAWITGFGTLIGAFLGASLAGLITYKVMKLQLRQDKLRVQREEIINHLKVNTHFHAQVNSVITSNEQLSKYLLEYDFNAEEKLGEIVSKLKIEADLYKDTYEKLQRLDERMLTFDAFRNYIICKLLINNMYHSLDYAGTLLEKNNPMYTDQLEDYEKGAKELITCFIPIKKLTKDYERELKDINKILNIE